MSKSSLPLVIPIESYNFCMASVRTRAEIAVDRLNGPPCILQAHREAELSDIINSYLLEIKPSRTFPWLKNALPVSVDNFLNILKCRFAQVNYMFGHPLRNSRKIHLKYIINDKLHYKCTFTNLVEIEVQIRIYKLASAGCLQKYVDIYRSTVSSITHCRDLKTNHFH